VILIDFLKEFLNTFDEVHYFIAGISIGFVCGIVFMSRYLRRVHQWFFSRLKNNNKKK